jgi:hypothetical protein
MPNTILPRKQYIPPASVSIGILAFLFVILENLPPRQNLHKCKNADVLLASIQFRTGPQNRDIPCEFPHFLLPAKSHGNINLGLQENSQPLGEAHRISVLLMRVDLRAIWRTSICTQSTARWRGFDLATIRRSHDLHV